MGTKLHLLALAVGITLTLTAGPVSAQSGTPVATPTGAPTGILGTVQVDALPSPDAEVWFIRLTLAPRGSMPLDKQIGPTVAFIESGMLVFVSDQPVAITGGSARSSATPGPPGMRETVAVAGQTVSVAEDTILGLRNDGRDPAIFLALFIFSPQRETEAMQQAQATGTAAGPPEEPKGLSQQPLGVTRASFPEGPGIVTIERVELPAATTGQVNLSNGAVAGGIERGGATITIDAGSCYIWPALLRTLDVRNVELRPGQSMDLKADDGFGCWNTGILWQADDAGATILRVRVLPARAGPVATPAS